MKKTSRQIELSKKLSVNQLAFANLHIMKHENKLSDADCYMQAGYKPGSRANAESMASSMLSRNLKVIAYIEACQVDSATKAGLTLEYLDGLLASTLKTDQSSPMLQLAFKRLGGLDGRSSKPIDLGDGDSNEKTKVILEKIASGEIPNATAELYFKGLKLQAELKEMTDLAERIKRIDEKINGKLL